MRKRRLLVVAGLMIASIMACNFPGVGGEQPIEPTPVLPEAFYTPTPSIPPTPTLQPTIEYDPVFESAPCQFVPPASTSPECGWLIVPEDRTDVNSPDVRLHVAIFRSANPQPDPVIHISGGPGSGSLKLVDYHFQTGHNRVLANRDYIMWDQRGTGLSQPALYCPERDDIAGTLLGDLSWEENNRLIVDTFRACRERIESEGVDLTHYTSADSAADLNDLIEALGYSEVNLYGVSYGTRLALTTMRDYPEHIRSVILDSPYPPQTHLYNDWPANAQRSLEVLFADCAADPRCSASYPDFETYFYETVDYLNANPVTVTGPDGQPAVINGDSVVDVAFLMFYRIDNIPRIPAMVYDARNGNFTTIINYLPLYFDRTVARAETAAVQCQEEVAFGGYDTLLEDSEDVVPQVRDYWRSELQSFYQICEDWDLPAAPDYENEAVESDIPTLILAGEYDPITPPEWAYLAAETLPNAQVIEFPETGHWIMRSGSCGWTIGLQFLDNPSGDFDISCFSAYVGPTFVLR